MYTEELFQLLVGTLVVGPFVALVLHRQGKVCARASYALLLIASMIGLLVSIDVITTGPVGLGWSLDTFFGIWTLSIDPLGAFFLLMISVVMCSVSIYSIGYVVEYEGRYDIGLIGALSHLFFLSLIFVLSANNVILFLISWEAMSVVSFLLVMFEGRKDGVASAGYLYLTMTHVGTGLITVSFLLMSFYSGSYQFADIMANAGAMPSLVIAVSFIFLFIGFGTKAGMVPLHIWLPAAHPAAPSNISALMSGVMVKMALLMMLRCFFLFLGPVETWWGLLVMLVGSVSALVGVLFALKENDIKSTLAYSTVENMGIILIGLGASLIFEAYGLTELSALAMLATLFHALNHAVFKSLLFLGAGSVVHATRSRNMEAMGGLIKPMPYTSALVLIGLLSMAAIPPLGGFVSEWLIFQSLLQSVAVPDVAVKILMSVSIAVLALTGALAVAMAVRLFGTTFLARDRSNRKEPVHESPRTMLWGMGLLAVLCGSLGLLSFWIIPYVDNVTFSVLGVSIRSLMVDGLVISPGDADFASMAPLVIAFLVASSAGVMWAFARVRYGKETVRTTDTWDCGTPLTPRNQYSGTGLSNPIVRVFSNILKPRNEVRSEFTSSPYIKKRVIYELHFVEVFEKYLYRPVVRFFTGIASRLTFIQGGSIQAYLAYIFIMLVLLLIIFR